MAKRATITQKAPAGAAPAAPAGAPAPPAAATPGVGAEPAPPAPAGGLTRVLVASKSPQGRRRAGQAFGPEPLELTVSDATLQLLEGDPQLIVKRG